MAGKLIGITGGIGAGKSVVSRIFRLKGYPVYDCDSRAKILMEESEMILSSLLEHFGEECFMDNGRINRQALARLVFESEEKRRWLNALVHAEVRRDLTLWAENEWKRHDVIFVESAIMVSSGLVGMCQRILLVEASEETRIQRALQRGGIDMENLMLRIEAQRKEFDSLPAGKTIIINNDKESSLLTRLETLRSHY